jgi:hypothetical protein
MSEMSKLESKALLFPPLAIYAELENEQFEAYDEEL